MGLKIGWTIVKVPADIAKLLIWKSIKLPSDISKKVGVNHIVSALDFVTPKFMKKELKRLKQKIPSSKWTFKLHPYVYTIATGHFGIVAYKRKIVIPRGTSKFTKTLHKSKANISQAFRKSKASISQARRKPNVTQNVGQSKTKSKKLFKTVHIPNGLKSYFRRLGKR